MRITQAALRAAVLKLNHSCCLWWLGAMPSKVNVYGFLPPCCPVALNALIVI